MGPSITAFFPCYNDSGTIASMVVLADMTLRQLTDDYEVIVVNDGSADHSGEILAELQQRYPQLRVVAHEKNRGYGGALRSGFASATKDLVFYTDGDAQYDPRELAILFNALTDDFDMVQGYKIQRSDPINRKIIGRIYHHVVNIGFGLGLRDVDCDFRLIRRSVFDTVRLESDSGMICVELMKRIKDAGFRIVQVPIHHYHRVVGISQFYNWRRVLRTGIDLLRLWYRLVVQGEARQAAIKSPTPVGSFADQPSLPGGPPAA